MTAREAHVSRERSGGDGSLEIAVNVTNVQDDEQAILEAFALAPPEYLGRQRQPHPASKVLGYDSWLVTFKYTIPEGEEPQEPPPQQHLEGELDFDISGTSQHITQCLEQIDYGAETGRSVKDAKVIGATGNSVEGTDTTFGAFRLSLSRIPPQITGEYLKNLARLVGKYNISSYTITGWIHGVRVQIPFDGGELKFLGATPAADKRFKYVWEAQENRTDIDIGQGIIIPTKKGWEHLWVMFEQEELLEPAVKIPVPHIAFVAKLPPGDANFQQFLGF